VGYSLVWVVEEKCEGGGENLAQLMFDLSSFTFYSFLLFETQLVN
jgi:hypothetical protein